MDFENIKMKNEEDVPESMSHGKYDWSKLIMKAKELEPGKVLTMPLEKYHQVTSIRSALGRYDKSRKYRVMGRKIDGKQHAIIKLADGYK